MSYVRKITAASAVMVTLIHGGVGSTCDPIEVLAGDTTSLKLNMAPDTPLWVVGKVRKVLAGEISDSAPYTIHIAIRHGGHTVDTAKDSITRGHDGPVKLIKGESDKYTLQCFIENKSASCPYVEYTFDKSKTPEDSNPLQYKQKWALIKSFLKRKTTLDADTTKLLSGIPDISGRDRVFRKFCDHLSHEYERFGKWIDAQVPTKFARVEDDGTRVTHGAEDGCSVDLFINAGKVRRQVVKNADAGLTHFTGCAVPLLGWDEPFNIQENSVYRISLDGTHRAEIKCYTLHASLKSKKDREETLLATYHGGDEFEGLSGEWVKQDDGSWAFYSSGQSLDERINDAVEICETLWAMKEWFYKNSEPRREYKMPAPWI
jgi:hypothetical protein